MPLVPFSTLMADAERRRYAVGYFEPWSVESLLAILRGAEEARAPAMVGHGGTCLPTLLRGELRHFEVFARAGELACEQARVPVSYLFNEAPNWEWAQASVGLGFNVCMYSNPADDPETHVQRVGALVRRAAAVGVEVEAELGSLKADETADTDPDAAADFVRRTGVNALGVCAGNRHLLTGRYELDLDLIARLAEAVPVPLVLHGGSGAQPHQLREAIARGVRQVNFGSVLRQAFLEPLADALGRDWRSKDPHELLGTGLRDDVMRPGLEALSALIAEQCGLLGSSGKA